MNLTATAVSLRPALHTREDESGVHLSVALPGVRKEDLKLTVQEGVLTLEAPRTNASTTYRLSTRLSRRLAADRIAARLENGVLEALIPLSEDAQPRSIQVN